jgi:hypothetical protein
MQAAEQYLDVIALFTRDGTRGISSIRLPRRIHRRLHRSAASTDQGSTPSRFARSDGIISLGRCSNLTPARCSAGTMRATHPCCPRSGNFEPVPQEHGLAQPIVLRIRITSATRGWDIPIPGPQRTHPAEGMVDPPLFLWSKPLRHAPRHHPMLRTSPISIVEMLDDVIERQRPLVQGDALDLADPGEARFG